jgi:serine/threonine protein kinase
MGTVFDAEHVTLGRSVAVKVLHPSQARKRDAVRRFHQEARAAGATLHPNICEVYDLGTLDDGSPYLVMEKLVGETLADRIGSEGGLPFEDVVDTLVQVLSGLLAAHQKGIVHRDIKPENVFLARRVGCPPLCKILDFGVSKVVRVEGDRPDLDLTRTGMVMGTPYYMSPEQARGDRDLDLRVDLYACGVILYEALTGRRPFAAANYNALLVQIISGTPRPARELRPALPTGFDPVIERAMARDRSGRYRTAAEFQRDLQALRDRYNLHLPAMIGEALRALETARPPSAGPTEGRVRTQTPTSLRRPPAPAAPASSPQENPPRRAEPTPSSLEIPIVFAYDTPTASDAAEFEEYPTQVHVSRFEESVAAACPQGSAVVESPAGPKAAAAVDSSANVRDTDVTGFFAVHDTDATGKPAAACPQGSAVVESPLRGGPDDA